MSIPYYIVKKELVREVQSVDDPKNSTITSQRMNQRDRRKDMIPLRSDSKAMGSPSDGQKNMVKIRSSIMAIDFSNTATRKERTRYENNFALGVNGQGPKPGPMKGRAGYPRAINKVVVVRR